MKTREDGGVVGGTSLIEHMFLEFHIEHHYINRIVNSNNKPIPYLQEAAEIL